MKLNYDCVREVLLYLESAPYIHMDEYKNVRHSQISLNKICDALPEFNGEDIYYALFNLNQAGYILASSSSSSNAVSRFNVSYITYAGHEFLESIKEPTVWKKTQSILGKIGVSSINVISKVASDVIVKLIAAQI